MLLGEGYAPTQSLKVQNSPAGLLTVVGITLVISSLLPTAFSQMMSTCQHFSKHMSTFKKATKDLNCILGDVCVAGCNEDTEPHRKHWIDSLSSLGTHRCFTLPHLSSTFHKPYLQKPPVLLLPSLFQQGKGWSCCYLGYRYHNHSILTMKSWSWLFIYLATWLEQRTPTSQTNNSPPSPPSNQTSLPDRSHTWPFKQTLQVQMFSSYFH